MTATRDEAAPVWVHGTALVLRERAILLRGPAGVGKTSLAEALIEGAGQRGWHGRLLGDDRVALCVAHGRLLVRHHPAMAGRIERRTQGIVAVPFQAEAVLGLVVDLVAAGTLPRFPETTDPHVELHGLALPHLVATAHPRHHACRIILEAAAGRS